MNAPCAVLERTRPIGRESPLRPFFDIACEQKAARLRTQQVSPAKTVFFGGES